MSETQITVGEGIKSRIVQFAADRNMSIREFERKCGLTNGMVSAIGPQGPTASVLSKIARTYPELTTDWLIKGTVMPKITKQDKGIPLLPFGAVAGYLSDNNGVDAFSGEKVYFPDFYRSGADCAIRVEGNSMVPYCENGDVLAIRVLTDPSFFQWGRVYVISTTQGCISKRLYPDPDDPDTIICHSENTAFYPDYKITKSDIKAIAIVVGRACNG